MRVLSQDFFLKEGIRVGPPKQMEDKEEPVSPLPRPPRALDLRVSVPPDRNDDEDDDDDDGDTFDLGGSPGGGILFFDNVNSDGGSTSPLAYRGGSSPISSSTSSAMFNNKPLADLVAEITELKRLLYSATTEERRSAIRMSIDALQRAIDRSPNRKDGEQDEAADCKPSLLRNNSTARPMSAHRSSLRTIPEDKPLVRALLYPTGGIQKVPEEEEDLSARAKPPTSCLASDPTSAAPGSITESIVHSASATCFDPNHPPEHVLDERDGKWWVTTGRYPQLLVIRFKQAVQIDRVMVLCHGAHEVALSFGNNDMPYRVSARNRYDSDPQVFNLETSACTGGMLSVLALELLQATTDFAIVRHIKLLRRTR